MGVVSCTAANDVSKINFSAIHHLFFFSVRQYLIHSWIWGYSGFSRNVLFSWLHYYHSAGTDQWRGCHFTASELASKWFSVGVYSPRLFQSLHCWYNSLTPLRPLASDGIHIIKNWGAACMIEFRVYIDNIQVKTWIVLLYWKCILNHLVKSNLLAKNRKGCFYLS